MAAIVAPALHLAARARFFVIFEFQEDAHVSVVEIQKMPRVLRGKEKLVPGGAPALDGETDGGGIGFGVGARTGVVRVGFRATGRFAAMPFGYIDCLVLVQLPHEDGALLGIGEGVTGVVPRDAQALLAGVSKRDRRAAIREIQPEQLVLGAVTARVRCFRARCHRIREVGAVPGEVRIDGRGVLEDLAHRAVRDRDQHRFLPVCEVPHPIPGEEVVA